MIRRIVSTKLLPVSMALHPPLCEKRGRWSSHSLASNIKLTLEGGYLMEYRITEKDAFTVIGVSKVFKYDTAFEEIPKFWTEHFQTVKGQTVRSMYGVCLEGDKGKDEFEYLIADNYKPWMDTPDGYVTKIIPKHTWAVFACKGALPKSLQDVNRKIFSDWLPGCKEYEIASGVNIEMYSNPDDFPQGNQDANYYSEIWIPVRKK
jgi:AraC family transcriptional regulator